LRCQPPRVPFLGLCLEGPRGWRCVSPAGRAGAGDDAVRFIPLCGINRTPSRAEAAEERERAFAPGG
jgi:hypothetical protein